MTLVQGVVLLINDEYKPNTIIMDYITVAKVSDFEKKSIISYSILGKKVGVIRRKDGSFYAIEVSCKHQGADLTAGTIVGNIATCYRHQWKYDLETGECINHESPPLRRYDLKIENNKIMVSLTPQDN